MFLKQSYRFNVVVFQQKTPIPESFNACNGNGVYLVHTLNLEKLLMRDSAVSRIEPRGGCRAVWGERGRRTIFDIHLK